MTDSFERIEHSDNKLFGERKLLLCGFAPEAQTKFRTLLEMLSLQPIPIVWVASDQRSELLSDLIKRPEGSGEGALSDLPRAIIVAGISEKELHALMSGCRKAGMKQALWAVLTPTSEKWPIAKLLKELETERKALSGK